MPDLPYRTANDRAAVQAFFKDRPEARRLFEDLARTIMAWGPVEIVATKSRVAFLGKTRFAWIPAAFLDGAIYVRWMLPHPLNSHRLRSSAIGTRWSHGTRIHEPDPELLVWLREAYEWDAEPEDAIVNITERIEASRTARRASRSSREEHLTT